MKLLILSLLMLPCYAISQVRVTYIAKCNGKMNISIQNEGGGTSQYDASDTFRESFVASEGQFLYISAQADQKNSDVSVEIYCDGRLLKQSKSSGDFVIASADCHAEPFKSDLIIDCKNITFTGEQCVYTGVPILESPDINAKSISMAINNKVKVVSKINESYYKVTSGTFEGYLWAGWFKKCIAE